eukprot:TRINITY_DN7347_c0_g1_i12.p1 TRINITY_DN7347_c0_g1~~TRINITY_DN7347_c0_g1_i12.p1  ORF type:complete len:548 (-),score=133.97 TRINITY_DN7347_c0_g1_i12:709-2352(-)
MDGEWRGVILSQLRLRKEREQVPYENMFMHINQLVETNLSLQEENESLETSNATLKQEKLQLEAALQVRAGAFHAVDSVTVQELQQKLLTLQEELTEMHRRKGENAQQVIDLSAAVKILEKEISEKETRIESLEAQILVLKQDMKAAENQITELESTNQLLKDEYQALQLALNSAESSLSAVKKENDLLITQLMALKAKDAERMNFENDMFMQQKHRAMQAELAEAAAEGKELIDNNPSAITNVPVFTGFAVPTKVSAKFEGHEGEVNCVTWDFFGKYLCTSGSDRKIKVWEVDAYRTECRATLVGSNAAVVSVDFDQNSTMVLGSCNDFATRVWTIDDCRLRHTLTGHSGKVMSAKFFNDATRIVSGSHDRTLKLWDLRGKSCISTKFAGSSCNDVVTTDQSVISGHFDKKVRFWDIRTSNEPTKELLFGGKVTGLDLTRDKNLLGVCARDDKISIVDMRTVAAVKTLQSDGFHVGCDWNRLSFSPDGQFLAAGAGDGAVYVWNVTTGVVDQVLRAHSAAAYAVSWHPGGLYIASVDKQKTCIVWS